MALLVLDTVIKSLRAKLAATQATAPVQFTSHWADSTVNGTLLVEDSTLINSAGLTSVELVAAPGASTKRDIKTVSAVNNDSVPQTVIIYILEGGAEHDIFRKTLTAGQSWNSGVLAGAGGGGGGGSGDMLKSTYDPNTDGIIDIPQGGTNAATAAAARTNLGLGAAALYGVGLTTGTVALGNTKLDDWAAPDDNTDLNVSLAAHGLAPKGTTGTTQYWRQDWTLATPAGSAGRTVLAANKNYYVRTDGNDSNDGSVNDAAHAFLTIQKAINVAAALDMSIYDVYIYIADGTYTLSSAILFKQCLGSGKVYIVGNTGTPANVVITTTTNISTIMHWNNNTAYDVQGIKFTSSGAGVPTAIDCQGASMTISNVNFGGTFYAHIEVYQNGQVTVGSYTISGAASYHFLVQQGGTLKGGGNTITLSGTPAFSGAFIYESECSIVYVPASVYSGSATGVRYSINSNSVCTSSGVTQPGNSAGSTATGGQYI